MWYSEEGKFIEIKFEINNLISNCSRVRWHVVSSCLWKKQKNDGRCQLRTILDSKMTKVNIFPTTDTHTRTHTQKKSPILDVWTVNKSVTKRVRPTNNGCRNFRNQRPYSTSCKLACDKRLLIPITSSSATHQSATIWSAQLVKQRVGQSHLQLVINERVVCDT